MKYKWKISEAPTGKFSSFQHREWPSAIYQNGLIAAQIVSTEKHDNYHPRKVKTGEHSPLKLRFTDHRAPSENCAWSWKQLKAEYATVEEAKNAFAALLKKCPDIAPPEKEIEDTDMPTKKDVSPLDDGRNPAKDIKENTLSEGYHNHDWTRLYNQAKKDGFTGVKDITDWIFDNGDCVKDKKMYAELKAWVKDKMEKAKPKKNVKESLAYLIEADMDNAAVIIAAQAIPEKLQTMAERLADIEGDDILPMMDGLSTQMGQAVAQRFSQAVTGKVRELIDATIAAKTAIDNEIANLSGDGAPLTDMGMDDSFGDEEAPPAPEMTDDQEEADPFADEEEVDLPDVPAAGRMKKESRNVRGQMVESVSIKRLRESNNPDELILSTFRTAMTKYPVSEAARRVAGMFEIDVQDVVQIVREAKEKKDDPCWTGYKQLGMKKKGKKMVPNCVKEGKKDKDKEKNPFGKKCPPFQRKDVEPKEKKVEEKVEMTLAQAKGIVSELGLVLKKTDDEYCVNYKGGKEATAYYTDDIKDAVDTARDMAKKKPVAESADKAKAKADAYKGVAKWVGDYKEMRKYGNVKDAKTTKENIEREIKKHGLDAAKVWGEEPDAKKVTKESRANPVINPENFRKDYDSRGFDEYEVYVGDKRIHKGWSKDAATETYAQYLAYSRGSEDHPAYKKHVKLLKNGKVIMEPDAKKVTKEARNKPVPFKGKVVEAQPMQTQGSMSPSQMRDRQDAQNAAQSGQRVSSTAPKPNAAPMPGKVMNAPVKPPAGATPNGQNQTGQQMPANGQKPMNGQTGGNQPNQTANGQKPPMNGQNPNQQNDGDVEMTDEDAPMPVNKKGDKSPETTSARASSKAGGTTLFSKNTPVPAPKHGLLDGGSKVQKTAESATVGAACAANVAVSAKSGGSGFFGGDNSSSVYPTKKKKKVASPSVIKR